MTTIAPPICARCRHLRGALRELRCDAFPAAIPRAILLSRADHREPFDGDDGIRFDPKDAAAAAYAAFLFAPGPDVEPRLADLPRAVLAYATLPVDWDQLPEEGRRRASGAIAREALRRYRSEEEDEAHGREANGPG